MLLNLDMVVAHLKKIKAEHGDENYHAALKGLFRDLVLKEGGSEYVATLLEKLGDTEISVDGMRLDAVGPLMENLRASRLNIDDLETGVARIKRDSDLPPAGPSNPRAPSERPPDGAVSVIERAIQQGMPHCKTKKQFELVLQASEALRIYLDAAYGFDHETAAKAREGLNTLLELAPKLATVTEKLEEHPEATTNKSFVDPPPNYSNEESIQKALLVTVATLQTSDELSSWYSSMKTTMDNIQTPRLRNELFDAIRERKAALQALGVN